MDKRIMLVLASILLLTASCNIFAETCNGDEVIYNESCNNILYSEGCGNYYTVIDGNKYGCSFADILNDLYCDVDLTHICDMDDNCTNATNNFGIFNFGEEVLGDVVNTYIYDYTCEGNKYFVCFWNTSVSAIDGIFFYNRYSLTINSTYANTEYYIDYEHEPPVPSSQYSSGFMANCNNTYVCIANNSEVNSSTMIETTHYYSVLITPTNCSTTTSTTTSTSSSTSSSSSSPSSSTSSSPSTTTGTPSSVSGTTLYGYSLPNGNFGTLPGLNGTGGVTAGNGTLKNMPCTGFCIIGLNKQEFQLYAAIMIIILVLISIKPFKLGALASAFALLFFNNIMGWTAITTSLMLIFVFIAVATWWMEGKQ